MKITCNFEVVASIDRKAIHTTSFAANRFKAITYLQNLKRMSKNVLSIPIEFQCKSQVLNFAQTTCL